jgi:hypothetical protein
VADFYQSETYTRKEYPSEAVQPVTPDPSVHGFNGPVQVSYPNYYWPQSGKGKYCSSKYYAEIA